MSQIQLEQLELFQYKKQELQLYNSSQVEYHKWFLDNAKGFTSVDKELSRKKSRQYRSKLKQCHSNCMRIFSHEHFSNSDLKLYTGFELSNNIGFPIEHTWLVLDNVVIDPTLAVKTNFSDDRFGKEYLGMEIQFKTMNSLMLELEIYTNFLPYIFQKIKCKNVK